MNFGFILLFTIILLILLPIIGPEAQGQQIETVVVTIEQIKPPHGFFTTEDDILLKINLYNNSTQYVQGYAKGTQRYLGQNAELFQDIEWYEFKLSSHESDFFERIVEKRWEGQ